MFKVLENGKAPARGSKYSACVDLYASEDITIYANNTELVGLGVCIDINKFIQENKDNFEMNFWEADEHGDDGTHFAICDEKVEKFLSSHYLQLMLRSSLSKHLIIANGVGVVDLDYEDEIKIRIHNPMNDRYSIKKGNRIAQITLLEHKSYLFDIKSESKRVGGFGSTNEKDKKC